MSKIKMPGVERTIMSGQVSTPKPLSSTKQNNEKLLLFDSWCKCCGICTHFCPTGAIELDEQGYPYLAFPDKCTLCGLCWMRCPDFAIVKGQNTNNGKKPSQNGGKNGKG